MSDVGLRDGIKANVLDVVNLDRHAPGPRQPTPGTISLARYAVETCWTPALTPRQPTG